MDVAKFKSELIANANGIRDMSNRITGASIVARYMSEAELREMFGQDGGSGIEELIARARVELGTLDRALAIMLESLDVQARLFSAQNQQRQPKGE